MGWVEVEIDADNKLQFVATKLPVGLYHEQVYSFSVIVLVFLLSFI